MSRLLLLTPAELTRDPRARRQATAALARGIEVVGLCGQTSGEPPAELSGVLVHRVGRGRSQRPPEYAGERTPSRLNPPLREAVGLYRLLRLTARTARLWAAGRRAGSFDVIHANDFETLPAASLLARRSRSRLVYDAHELYAEFEPDPPRAYRSVAARLEGALARRADSVVTVSRPLADELRGRLRLPRMPFVVLNAPELDEHAGPQIAEAGPVRAVYQGAFGPGRPFEDLLEALALAPNASLTVRVVHADPTALRAAVRRRGLGERVVVADPLPPAELISGLRGFDAGLIFDRPLTRNAELSLPNKLFDYLMAGLAVVVPALPALAPFVEDAGVGLTFQPGRPDRLGECLERLAADRETLAEMRARSLALARGRYNAERQSETLEDAWGLKGAG